MKDTDERNLGMEFWPERKERIVAGRLGEREMEEMEEMEEGLRDQDQPSDPGALADIVPVGVLSSLRALRLALVAFAAILLVLWAMSYGAAAAFAQAAPGSGGGDAIQGTIANVRDYIAGLLLVLGGLGFVVSLGLKAASPINENAQYLSHMGLKSSCIAVLGGAIVGPVMDIVQGLAQGGGAG